ncbi:GNAT family N-acetyltransferase [Actinosynnema sp. NPDC020468]|uniref:GNAT family N-acetyltransferase n=1 Tax=Actinosynnema sp. NPDC020468 TaxID=3154488 RepID=UPI0034079C7B
MEPVEINAGELYLRALRVDDRIDDRVALVEGGRFADAGTAGEFISARTTDWAADEGCSWAVCEQLGNTAVGEISLTARGAIDCWTTPDRRGEGIGTAALDAVLRFGFGFLELPHVDGRPVDPAGIRLAQKCGFAPDRSRGVWTRLR